MSDQQRFFANGKLLITGEYFVLDGALALALPTRACQSMQVIPTEEKGELSWSSYDADGTCWFSGRFALPDGHYVAGTDAGAGNLLAGILASVTAQRPGCWPAEAGWKVECRLDFPRAWGLGTSSTLLSLIAQWTRTNPFLLLEASFGGSGYDLACARAGGPILFQRLHGEPHFVRFPFNPAYAASLFFVYLGKKQNSREGIAHYRQRAAGKSTHISHISQLTARLLKAESLADCESILRDHEATVAEAIDLPRAFDLYFPDYWGAIKSLGAWGGDFVLATSNRSPGETDAYFKSKGYSIILPYHKMVLE